MLEGDVNFVIVGGFAGVLHGASLVTRDLDLCLLVDPTTIERLRVILKDLHPAHRMTPNKISFLEFPEDPTGVQNIYLSTDCGILDLISNVSGIGDYNRVASSACEIELFGRTCKVISIDDLIQSKIHMGRNKDLAMVKELKVIQEKIKK